METFSIFTILVCLLSYFRSTSCAAATFFRRDYDFFCDQGAFYKVHTVPKTWNDARKQCILEGSALAVPNDGAEAEVFRKIMEVKLGAKAVAFLGIQAFSKGIFTTLDGIFIDDIYHSWAPGEPNDAGGTEDCIIMDQLGKLNDENCERKYAFICEKSQDSVMWNDACETSDLEYTRVDNMEHCYKVHLEPKNWTDAYAICVHEQSYLAILNSREESKALIKLFETKPHRDVRGNFLSGAIHLGFHDRFKDGVFTTIQGESLAKAGYEIWGGGQPGDHGEEYCGSMFYDGGLNDMNCGVRCFFICEREAGDGGSAIKPRFGG